MRNSLVDSSWWCWLWKAIPPQPSPDRSAVRVESASCGCSAITNKGVKGLRDKPGRGKPPLLNSGDRECFKQRIDAGPTPEDGVCTLRGKDLQRILKEEFGKVRSLDTVYSLLHQLRYSSLVPRPQHRLADPAAQEVFKKSSRRGSKR